MSTPPTTTNDVGIPVASDKFTATVGTNGPILLHDHHFVEKMAAFDRERVPERVVHAKGAGAHGRFEVTNDISQYTKAKVLQPSTTTPMFARFSTVAGELGSADAVRDPRGFSLKFYTEDGNWDLVGNNTPIFFIKEPHQFPDFIRSQKRRADTGRRDEDMMWDFWTLTPESAHQVAFLMGDRGIPRTLRHMNGYGSHTFTMENEAGEVVYVKFHLKTDQGIENLTADEAAEVTKTNADVHREDLWQSIEDGDHPSWTMHIQVMPVADAGNYRFNPFDLTNVWPHGDYPLIEVGRMTLDRNPTNYFTEVEQAAFEPSNVVPGIGFSPDRMLLGRVFSYPDTHRHRIGPNYKELPINRPADGVEVNSYAKDGPMRHVNPGDPVYAPNSYGGPRADEQRGRDTWRPEVHGSMHRDPYAEHPEDSHWGQVGTFVREVLDDDERDRLVSNVVGHVKGNVSERVMPRVFEYWRNIDDEVGARIEKLVTDSDASPKPGDNR